LTEAFWAGMALRDFAADLLWAGHGVEAAVDLAL